MSIEDELEDEFGRFDDQDEPTVLEIPTTTRGETDLLTSSEADPLPLSPAGDGEVDGRDPQSGRFLQGNRLGRGNPLARRAATLRAELFHTTTRQRMQNLVDALLTKAERGDVAAAKLVLQYTLGEPQSIDLIETVAKLEAVILKGVR